MDTIIRTYQNKDYLGLYNLYVQFSPARHPQEIPDESPEKIHAWLNKLLSNSQCHHLVLEDEEHILGHGMICVSGSNTAHLSVFFGSNVVTPHDERQLFASLAHEACKDLHLGRVRVECANEEDPLLRLAEKFGFRQAKLQTLRGEECILERKISCEQCLYHGCPFYEPSQSCGYRSTYNADTEAPENPFEQVPSQNAALYLEAASYFAVMGQAINSLFFHKKTMRRPAYKRVDVPPS